MLVGTYLYGNYRLGQDRFDTGPTVCLLQTNLDQRIRNEATRPDNDGHSAEAVRRQFALLCEQAAFKQAHKPDLLIWPETSYPGAWYQVSPKLPIEKVTTQWRDAEVNMRWQLEELAGTYTKIPHLLGMNTNYLDEHGKYRRFNSALLVSADGRVEARFDKMHRVPFGEYVPFKDWIPFMSALAPYDFDYSIQEGEKFTRFALGDYHFGVLVCFEDTDPFLARQYLRPTNDGPAVDFLVNMSNDGWFDGSSEHEEHLVVSRFRAIECRRALVRAVNMGVSAVIDGNGRVLKPTLESDSKPPVWTVANAPEQSELAVEDWAQFKQVAGILKAAVPIDRRFSFYTLAGDWLPIGCWLVLLGRLAAWSYARTAT